jgi:hypothetical protein
MFSWCLSMLRAFFDAFSLLILLSVVATMPVLQFASFGYMLESAARLSRGMPVRLCFPGARIAGNLLVVMGCAFLSWLPVWFVADMAYTGEIIEIGSPVASRLRILARVLSVVWVLWVLWAIFRGGKFRHFVWPAPMMAVRRLLRGGVWREAEDRLWIYVSSFHLPRLLWLGFMASVGALVWFVLPSSLIVIGLSSGNAAGAGLVGLVGAVWMAWVLLHLPFLQIQLARESKFLAVFDLKSSRRAFRQAPWALCFATWVTLLLAIPLYLLRIEPPPSQLWWILSIFFVVLMFPAKLSAGWALQRSDQRAKANPNHREVFWFWRYCAWIPQISMVAVYLGVLYVAKFAVWEGAASIYLQHAFLPPVPFFVR